jgi:hypothetical protein
VDECWITGALSTWVGWLAPAGQSTGYLANSLCTGDYRDAALVYGITQQINSTFYLY